MVRTAQGQIALLKVWSSGTDIAIDARKAPKAEFSRLAKAKGWEGGDSNWKSHWEACFGEAYSYGTTSAYIAPFLFRHPGCMECAKLKCDNLSYV
jgi:hypothetical protein